MMGYAIQKRGCHLGIAEDAGPFTEREVGRHDDRGPLVELADEMEQELTAGPDEREIAKLVQDHEV